MAYPDQTWTWTCRIYRVWRSSLLERKYMNHHVHNQVATMTNLKIPALWVRNDVKIQSSETMLLVFCRYLWNSRISSEKNRLAALKRVCQTINFSKIFSAFTGYWDGVVWDSRKLRISFHQRMPSTSFSHHHYLRSNYMQIGIPKDVLNINTYIYIYT